MELATLFQFYTDNVGWILLCAMALGCFVSAIAKICFNTSKNMTLTLALLPAVVAAALVAINGSLGVGIAILGVFGLVRFRSLPGKSTDIINVFYAMTAGLVASTGYLLSAIAITVALGLFFWVAIKVLDRVFAQVYTLVIQAPEEESSLDQFENILKENKISYTFESVRTTHMGTLFEYTFIIQPPRNFQPAPLLNDIRICNGNLGVTCRKGTLETSL